MPKGNIAVDADGLEWPRLAGVTSAMIGSALTFFGVWSSGLHALSVAGAVLVLAVLWTDVVTFLPRSVLSVGMTVGALLLVSRGDNPGLFLLILASGEAATTGTITDTIATLLVATAGIGLRMSIHHNGFSNYGGALWPAGCLFTAGGGRTIRALMQLNNRLQSAQATIAEQAATDERRRLAREIHDVIAHSMTVTMLHVTAARLALQDKPPSVDEAIDALAEAETQGRRSLADIRQTIGLLTTDESPLDAPVPGVADLQELIDSFSSAGVTIDFGVRGRLDRLSPATGAALYRVVQEGLANAAKHAPGAPVSVGIHVRGHTVCATVSNGAPDRQAIPIGLAGRRGLAVAQGGRGVPGMTDRVRQMGGRFRAGPTRGGWEVEADLPLAPGRPCS